LVADVGKEIGEEGELEFLGDGLRDHEEDESTTVFAHAFDCVGGDELGGDNQIGFSFSGFIIINKNEVSFC
jgi:hypothetical protein